MQHPNLRVIAQECLTWLWLGEKKERQLNLVVNADCNSSKTKESTEHALMKEMLEV